MTESFAQLFEESLKTIEIRLGSMIRGTVISIEKDIVRIDAGLKSESSIPLEQFKSAQGVVEIQIGDEVDLALDSMEDGFGETLLSREKAKRQEVWKKLEEAYTNGTFVTGMITGKVKGGFTVDMDGIRAFLPGSLVDVHPVRDTSHLENKEHQCKIIKLDKKRNNVVVSRRDVIKSENSAEREQLLERLKVGQEVSGTVKNLTDYGAFVELGGIDGLLHITDMSLKRVKHPSEVVSISDQITVKILKIERRGDEIRISLGLKQLSPDPWVGISERYKANDEITGCVTNIPDYGCFVEIEPGVEGLVHVSEMDWTNKNIHPSKVVKLKDSVKVKVLDIDEQRRRISLGLKQCTENPWEKFDENHNKGDIVKGKIKSITDFGIFIGLEDNIDGLVHLSDISWNVSGQEAVREYKKGQEIEAVLSEVIADRERISLSIKQLSEDPLDQYISLNKKGTLVSGQIIEIHDKKIFVTLTENGVKGCINLSDLPETSVDFPMGSIEVGHTIEAKYTGCDRKARLVTLAPLKDETEKKESVSAAKNNKKEEANFSNTPNAMTEAFKIATKGD
ncbi:30S ribosomal protein S1 [Candidatus Hamiltonella endosymbiont of Tuberolachnus salignus]|uniref:30S ribosomal protein S1 n=1 Tax=Candidatus Williamhamiltonella endosymbiont of Tuberolachnus salignus TaxID=3077954 RepID=UPI0030D4D5F8